MVDASPLSEPKSYYVCPDSVSQPKRCMRKGTLTYPRTKSKWPYLYDELDRVMGQRGAAASEEMAKSKAKRTIKPKAVPGTWFDYIAPPSTYEIVQPTEDIDAINPGFKVPVRKKVYS